MTVYHDQVCGIVACSRNRRTRDLATKANTSLQPCTAQGVTSQRGDKSERGDTSVVFFSSPAMGLRSREGSSKGLVEPETTGAPIQLGAFSKGNEVIKKRGMYTWKFGRRTVKHPIYKSEI